MLNNVTLVGRLTSDLEIKEVNEIPDVPAPVENNEKKGLFDISV